jgi:hypothetical protein
MFNGKGNGNTSDEKQMNIGSNEPCFAALYCGAPALAKYPARLAVITMFPP